MSLARGPLEIPRPVEDQSAAVDDSGGQRSHADAVELPVHLAMRVRVLTRLFHRKSLVRRTKLSNPF